MARTVVEAVETRILNRDGVGMIVERLDQKRIGELVKWFLSKGGGAEGATIVLRAPLFDTIIERNVEGACHSRHNFRAMALVLFGAGLGVAALWLAERESGSAFPVDADLHTVLGALEEFRLPAPCPAKGDAVTDEFDPVRLMRRVCKLDGRVDVVVQAIFRVAMQFQALSVRSEASPMALAGSAWSRLIFVAGMVAAGIAIPVLPTSKCKKTPSRKRKARSRRT